MGGAVRYLSVGACHQYTGGSSWPRSRQHEGSISMVPRYSRPEMDAIWAPENRYRIWFEIEALAAEGMAQYGLIPATAARAIREKGGAQVARITAADVARIDAIERET